MLGPWQTPALSSTTRERATNQQSVPTTNSSSMTTALSQRLPLLPPTTRLGYNYWCYETATVRVLLLLLNL